MTDFERIQANKIASCYINNIVVDNNIKEIAKLHSESSETKGFQELEDEKIVTDFDEDNTEEENFE